jgi:hypothetical protein
MHFTLCLLYPNSDYVFCTPFYFYFNNNTSVSLRWTSTNDKDLRLIVFNASFNNILAISWWFLATLTPNVTFGGLLTEATDEYMVCIFFIGPFSWFAVVVIVWLLDIQYLCGSSYPIVTTRSLLHESLIKLYFKQFSIFQLKF